MPKSGKARRDQRKRNAAAADAIGFANRKEERRIANQWKRKKHIDTPGVQLVLPKELVCVPTLASISLQSSMAACSSWW
eukprot:CAMPEP_0195001986 /NCGR_PEP_ID=MMETSP0326_2-20130528/2057_1 /TAXON_ID=2866 ORGANISM="Crypthecodinium cohnii, Strain Seligo" /NCGR_SAMPLE_ID=MMETSP0326_2 /ASSEMBLY_ACC=CAM_ASM_000348 /LENGTH=78 /DNA_ID=CAMNT_0040005107 /DNA_START=132 /DNA_END=368 /DNA_ORIENTATION=-